MASLTIGGVAIPVAPGSGSWDWNDAIDRRRAFDNTYRASATGGAARDGRWSTPPVTRTNAGIYRGVLQQTAAQMCSGDLIEIPTMCCAELINESPVKQSNGSLVTLNFALHEVQGKKLLLKYSPGDTITGESFSRSTTATYRATNGDIATAGINVKRDNHYPTGIFSGTRSILLEGAATNSILQSGDVSPADWTKVTMTVGAGVADPAGLTNARPLTATAGNANINQVLSAGSSLARTGSVWLRRRTGSGDVQILKPDNSGWSSPVALTSSWQRFSVSTAASTARAGGVLIVTNGDAVDMWGYQLEDGTFPTSYIPTTTVAVTRAADSYSLPFTTPPQESTFYVKFVEGGTKSVASAAVFDISNSAGNSPLFFVLAPAGFYASDHGNGSATVVSTLAAAPVLGDTNELVARLFGDGSTDITQSINGAAATAALQSAVNALATAWSGQLAWLNSAGSGSVGFTAIQKFVIVAGARSLAEMRAA